MIQIEVRYFNILARSVGAKQATISMPLGATLGQLLDHLAQVNPVSFKQIAFRESGPSPYLRIFHNETLVSVLDTETALADGDTVMLFPAISGG